MDMDASPVVDDERHARVGAHLPHHRGPAEQGAGVEVLVA